MKRLQLSLCFLTLCFRLVHLSEFDEKKQISFLQDRIKDMKCWTDADVLSRTVLIDYKPTSINDLFQVSNASYLSTWPITERNVNEVSRLMKTVMACEYVNNFYSLLLFLEKYLDNCLGLSKNESSDNNISNEAKKTTNHDFADYRKCVEKYYLVVLKLPGSIMNMMCTLMSFEKNRNNFVSGKQDFLKMLVSWYQNLNQYSSIEFPKASRGIDYSDTARQIDREKVSKITDNIQSIVIQMKIDIKDFCFQHCQQQNDFITFVSTTTILVNVINDRNNIVSYLEKVPRTLSKYMSLQCINDKSNHYIPHDSLHSTLLEILNKNTNIQMQWKVGEWLTFPQIYDKYIKTSLITQDILRYENAMLSVMTGLVYGKLANELKSLLMSVEYVQNMNNKLTYISDMFDAFLTNIQSRSLPMIFFCNMLELSYQMHSIILYARSNLKQSKIMLGRLLKSNKIDYDISNSGSNIVQKSFFTGNLVDFLNNFVFEHINSSYLNQSIVNLIGDKAYVTMTQPFEYAVDFKNIYPNWVPKLEQSDETCQTNIPLVKNKLNIVLKSAVKYYTAVMKYTDSIENDKIVEKHLNSVRRDVFAFKKAVINLFLYADYDDVHGHLRKLLLTVILNVENVRLFGRKTEWLVNSERLESLFSFHSNCESLITKYHLIVCRKPTGEHDESSSMMKDNQSLSPSLVVAFTKPMTGLKLYVKTFYANFNKQDVHHVLHNAPAGLGLHFNFVKRHRDLVLSTLNAFDGRLIKFIWNGQRTSFFDVISELEYRAFEIQGLVEYQYMTVKWIVCSLLSAVLNILNGIVMYGLDISTVPNLSNFITIMYYLQNLPYRHFTPRAVTVVFQEFSNILSGGGTEDSKRNLRTFVMHELMMFGVVFTTLPNTTGDHISEYLDQLCKNVDLLRERNFENLFETIGFKEVLGDGKMFIDIK